jgi:histidyl-tRNA synthetase
MKIEKIKGFRDHYPEDMEIRNSIFNKITDTAENFGYKRIDFPSLELLEMYRLKSGSELVNQTFSFTDKGGREVTLIPEATPSTMRLLTSRKDLPRPVRWYSFPKVWRYEEPQEGRFREHYQFNSDLFGIDSPEADAEVIGMASKILDNLGLLGVYEININDRYLMEYILKDLNVNDINSAFSIIDKYRKIGKNSFYKLFNEINVDEKSIDKIMYLLSGKINIKNLKGKLIKVLNNYNNIEDRVNRISRTFEIINYYTQSKINYDFSVVRGLSYYTGIVFEAFDIQGELRAILGGGRYNNLSTLFSDEEIPAAGFAIGDAVIEILLKRNNLWLNNNLKASYYICSTTDNYNYPIKIANDIRNKNKIALVDITTRKLSAQIKNASSYNYAIIIGDNEIKNNSITIKNMSNGEQKTIKYLQFIDSL